MHAHLFNTNTYLVHMFVYVYVCMYASMYVFIRKDTQLAIFSAHVGAYACKSCVFMYVCVYVCIYT
jgi:hypothetical protein